MKFRETENVYVVRLFKGEYIIQILTDFCNQEKINSAVLSGIGGAKNITLGFFNLETKNYSWQNFPKTHEIVSLTGNVFLVENEPYLHIHTVIANENFETFGGHLKEATVAATCEVVITKHDCKISRSFDDSIGLKLLDLD